MIRWNCFYCHQILSHRKEGELLYYQQISMNSFHQFDLLYSWDAYKKLNNVGSAEKKCIVFSTSKLQEYSGLTQSLKLCLNTCLFKGAFSGLTPFLANESPLKMTKNVFYFSSKTNFVLEIFKFLSWIFRYVSKRLD